MESHPLRLLVLLLAAAVILPTLCLLWFMQQAVKNERLAVRQRVVDLYQNQFTETAAGFDTFWQGQTRQIDSLARQMTSPQRLFATLVHQQKLCAGVVILNPDGELLYPSVSETTRSLESLPPVFDPAKKLEYITQDFSSAAEEYRKVAQLFTEGTLAARALFAQARCLLKAGEPQAALGVYINNLGTQKFQDVRDPSGQPISIVAQLKALEILRAQNRTEASKLAAVLCAQATDYDHLKLNSNLRSFLLEKISELSSDLPLPSSSVNLQTYITAEEISLQAGDQLVAKQNRLPRGIVTKLYEDTYVLLYESESLVIACLYPLAEIRQLCWEIMPAPDAGEIYVVRCETGRTVWSTEAEPPEKAFVKVEAGRTLPGWQVEMHLDSSSAFSQEADKQIALYLWSGSLVIALILIAGTFAVRSINRQYKLNQLKNDFIATVTHELKTPLASMRVLVDTLLEGRYQNQQQVEDYLQLVSKENARLSRLIDNFLTFSRMERNKRSFEMATAFPSQIAHNAVEAVRTKFASNQCSFDMQIAENLPEIWGDQDALVTVLINLLDNACKYTYDEKQIQLRTFAENGFVCFQVRDNGVGLSKRALKKIFERFYQADQSLSRPAEGCGLGLSIVKFIVDAHQGTIAVDSQPGEGSAFTVKIPVRTVRNG
jgi:two-component system, OmpR family, phosphate regulon sensor histidine kinase PhoR